MATLEMNWIKEAEGSMHGWDFTHLDGRWSTEPLPWNYSQLVRENLMTTDRWLDKDTGGGELMTGFQHAPALTAVTESWTPSIELLKQTVVPREIQLYAKPGERLTPIPTASFDTVTNSHGSLDLLGIKRVLKPGGTFITQQVGATNNFGLSRFFDESYQPAYPDNQLLTVVTRMQAIGFQIMKAETAHIKMSFTDVGAVVYYATVIPWEFPNFNVHRALSKLQQLQRLLGTTGTIETFADRFVIVARKPE